MDEGSGAAKPALGGGTAQKAAQRLEHVRLVEKERIVPLVAHHLDEAHVGGGGGQRAHDGPVLRRGIEPVAGERDHAEASVDPAKRIRQHAVVVGPEIEVVDRPGNVEVGVGVKALHEALPLVAEVALHLEVCIEAVGDVGICPAARGRTSGAAPIRRDR